VALGAALGGLPLVAMFALAGGAVFDIHGQSALGRGLGEQLATLASFAASIYAERGPLGSIAVSLLPAAVLAGVVLGLRGADAAAGPRRFLILYLLFALAAYAASSFAVDEVYHWILLQRLSQVWLLATLALAASWPRWRCAPRTLGRIAGTALLVAPVVVGAWSAWAIPAQGRPGSPRRNVALLLRTRGYTYEQYFGKILAHLEGTEEQRLRLLTSFRDDPALLYPAAAAHVFERSELTLDECVRTCRAVGGDSWRELVRGFGWTLLHRHDYDLAAALRAARGADPELAPILVEALGRVGRGTHATVENLTAEVAFGLEVGAPRAFFEGLGRRLYLVKGDQRPRGYFRRTQPVFLVAPDDAAALLESFDPAVRGPLRAGYDRAVALNTLGGPLE